MTIRLHRGDLPNLSAYKGAVAIDTETLGRHAPLAHPSLEDILAVDAWSRRTAQELIAQWSPH